MRSVNIAPTWKYAAQIYIMCLENGQDENAKEGARKEIMRMAELLDTMQEQQREAQK